MVVGVPAALSATATSGFLGLPFSAAAPTATPADATNPSCAVNITSKALNCYIPGVGWYHSVLAAGAL